MDVAAKVASKALASDGSLKGVGLGLRREIAQDLLNLKEGAGPSFVEFAPENWLGVGGYWGKVLDCMIERYPVSCHGLSLSLGSPDPLDRAFLRELKDFLQRVNAQLFSEHLSYAKCDNAHLYDLLPIPFTKEAAYFVADRIRETQDLLERSIAIENVSYYASIAPQMDEVDFLNLVLERADCKLLLDINNVYVNAHNHQYDAKAFLSQLPLERVACIHIAGHRQFSEELILDDHGSPIIDPVYELLEWTLPKLHPVPILLERDRNLNLAELLTEVAKLQEIASNQLVGSL